jgi:hypothetical protein
MKQLGIPKYFGRENSEAATYSTADYTDYAD